MSGSGTFPRSLPYNQIAPLPPLAAVETNRTLKLAISARSALAELRGGGRLIPNQAMLVRAIVLQEAKLSSEIENVVTTNDELYRALSQESIEANPHTKEVLRYGEAVWAGVSHLKSGQPLTPGLFSRVASIINDAPTQARSRSGTRIVNSANQEIVYTPPDGASRIESLLQNLCDYLFLEDGVEPLIKLAVAHYQFEAIHPFPDGNGRTGRVLNILYLIDQGLLEIPVLYLSRYIIRNKGDYYRGLRRVTEEGAWEDWVSYMVRAVEVTAVETRHQIEAIHEAMQEARATVKARAPRIYSHELIEAIYSQPYTRIRTLEEFGVAKRQTASVYLKKLEEIGLLTSAQSWRDTLYLNPRLLELLTT